MERPFFLIGVQGGRFDKDLGSRSLVTLTEHISLISTAGTRGQRFFLKLFQLTSCVVPSVYSPFEGR